MIGRPLLRTPAALVALAALLILAGRPAPAAADDYPSELPPAESVRSAIDSAPDVRSGIALLEAALAQRRQLIAGPHEWVGLADVQHRRATSSGAAQDYREWELALERPLRAPSKARIDGRLGDQTAAQAQLALADLRHETSRRLLELWYSWLRERATTDALRRQAQLVSREAGVIGRREQLGDASRLDRMQGQAAVAQADAAAQRAEERAMRAEIMIRNEFPTIPFPTRASLPDPTLPGPDLAALAATALEENHELLLAQANARRAHLESQRAIAERRPDPTVGVRYRSELGGADRIVGVYVSIPFAGEARRAASDAAAARAGASSEQANAMKLRLTAEVRALEQAVRSGQMRWQAAEDAAALQASVAERVALAHRLGETGFSEVLLMRRQALEARLAATAAQVDALANRARLLLDAHRLWEFDSTAEAAD